eukprot:TRINITY_DN3575_c0_g1_i4.p1 TRINITY_DN3575_c0_g1~~TRINITY_DN3575_c0_g1_i4.p1  ORF type:complete len:480 (-),score=113.16 TRINITY_DN3575_c0_g1_i4:113-1552(-)
MDLLKNLSNTLFGEYSSKYPLHQAASKSEHAKIYELLKSGMNSADQDTNGKTALHVSASLQDQAGVVQFCKFGNKKALSVQDNNGDTPLHIAAKVGHFRCARTLLENGSPKMVVNKNGQTALHIAAVHSIETLMQILNYLPFHKAFFLIHLKDNANQSAFDLAKNENDLTCAYLFDHLSECTKHGLTLSLYNVPQVTDPLDEFVQYEQWRAVNQREIDQNAVIVELCLKEEKKLFAMKSDEDLSIYKVKRLQKKNKKLQSRFTALQTIEKLAYSKNNKTKSLNFFHSQQDFEIVTTLLRLEKRLQQKDTGKWKKFNNEEVDVSGEERKLEEIRFDFERRVINMKSDSTEQMEQLNNEEREKQEIVRRTEEEREKIALEATHSRYENMDFSNIGPDKRQVHLGEDLTSYIIRVGEFLRGYPNVVKARLGPKDGRYRIFMYFDEKMGIDEQIKQEIEGKFSDIAFALIERPPIPVLDKLTA